MKGSRRIGAVAAVLAAAALLVALAYLTRGGVDTGPAAVETEVAPGAPQSPLVVRADRTEPTAGPVPEGAGEQYATPPCDGCLNEPGALDVAETFLYHMQADYIDVRTELYSDIAARLEAAGLPPPHETWLPKLPPGLVDAPADYSVSNRRLPGPCSVKSPAGLRRQGCLERPGETWVVWVQEGWFRGVSLDTLISEDGPLPPAAASWPPLKWETYLLVDARTGAVDASVMWPLGTPSREDMHAYADRARREAATRAEHWIAKSSSGFDE